MLKSKNKLLHKALAFALTFSLLATLVSFNFTANAAGGTYGSGNGTASDPYIIDDVADLTAFATLVNGGDTDTCAKLSDTFNVGAISDWTPIGNADNKFTGVFDGNGQTITINITDGDYVGLFGVNEGTIKNVTVAGDISSSTEKAFVGGVAGLNRGTITNCTNSATISATGANSYAGGIAGVMQYGTIDTCTNSDTINVNVSSDTSSSDITDHEASAGGIVAFNYNGTVKKSTNTGNITNNDSHGYTGGIVGNNDGVIDNCLNNNATITNESASSYIGGIAGNLFTNNDTGSTATISNSLNTTENGNVVGSNGIETKTETKGTIENCYYLDNNVSVNENGTPVTETQLNSGAVTYMLNGNSSANPVWGQTLNQTNNSMPIIGANESNTVYPSGNDSYSNERNQSCNHADGSIEDGSCDICGYTAAKLDGYNVILDGQINLKYTYIIDDDYLTATITPTFKTEKDTVLEHSEGSLSGNTYTVSVYVDSDEMNENILSSLEIRLNDKTITLNNNPYSVNKYLNTLYCDPNLSEPGKEDKTKKLVQAMSTYGYYANEYFGYNSHYETTVPMTELTVKSTDSTLNDKKYNLSYEGDKNTLTHYASSLQHLEKISGVFYVSGVIDKDNTVMAYQVVNVDNKNPIQGYETEKYSNLTNKESYYWAYTDKIPVQQLKNVMFKVTFGTKTEGSYTAQSNIKYYSPYGYIRNILVKYENSDPNGKEYKFTQALYHYSEAAADYFGTSTATE